MGCSGTLGFAALGLECELLHFVWSGMGVGFKP